MTGNQGLPGQPERVFDMGKIAIKASIITACFFAAACAGYAMHLAGWGY